MARLGIDQQMKQLGVGSFRSSLAVRLGEEADLYSDRFAKAVSMSLQAPPGMVGMLLIPSRMGPALASGHVANDKLLFLPAGAVADVMIPDLTACESISFPARRFLEMTEAICPAPTPASLEKIRVIKRDMAQLQALRKALVELVAAPTSDTHAEQLPNIVVTSIAWMADYWNRRSSERVRYVTTASHIAKRAQNYIETHYRGPVRTEDVCRATNVSVRTLQSRFREYFGLTISDYLKMTRLDAARRELVSAHPTEETVASIALRHGFTHLGRFSIEFRSRFGESPKETLRRRIRRTFRGQLQSSDARRGAN